MVRSRQAGSVVIPLLTICGALLLPLASSGQGTGPNLTGSSNCTTADLDAYLQFVNGPADYYAIVVNKRNISSHPCIFDGPNYAPGFVPDRIPGNPQFTLRYDSERYDPSITPVVINPGQVVRQTFGWKTRQPAEEGQCLQPQWMSGPVLLVAPLLLKQICSAVEVSQFSLATLPDSAPMEGQTVGGAQAPRFELTSDRRTYYQAEQFSLHLALAQFSPQTPSQKDENCPTLYLRQRSPDGTTRIDQVGPLAFKGCPRVVLGHQPGDWRSGFDLDSGANSRWEGLGEHAMQVFQLIGTSDDPQLHFASSNILRIQLADPSAVPRQWGPRVKGIAADVTLDKDTFRLGEDVPLHLAVENFDAAVLVDGPDPLWDPCAVVGIEVQDAEGRPLPPDERFPYRFPCLGHGAGPMPYAKGKVVPLERTLEREGWLPNHPGAYTVVVTWAPYESNNNAPTAESPRVLKPYAVVHAMATIHIVSSDSSHFK